MPVKYSSLERGFTGLSVQHSNICAQKEFGWFLDPSEICIKRECMNLQVAPLFHICPSWCECEIQTVQDKQKSYGKCSSSTMKSYVTWWGGVSRVAFWGRETRVWPVLFFVPTLTKTHFSSQEAWEEFAPGNDRSSSWKRAQTGLQAEQKGQALIRVHWHFLVWSLKKQFCYGRFLECPWQKCDWPAAQVL